MIPVRVTSSFTINPESVFTFSRNQRSRSTGIGVQIAPEYAAPSGSTLGGHGGDDPNCEQTCEIEREKDQHHTTAHEVRFQVECEERQDEV